MPELYNLENDCRPGELGGTPLIFGSALRFPSTAYLAWGIGGDLRHLHNLALSMYREEFFDTSPEWGKTVSLAAERGGIGDRPQMLRDAAGDAAAKLTYQHLRNRDVIRVMDVGCGFGKSLTAYLDALKQLDASLLERLQLTGVDLSRKNRWAAEDMLAPYGFVPGKNLQLVDCRDVDMPAHIGHYSQDIVLNMAGIHANAELAYPMKAISYVMEEGGYFVSADWHHRLWLHPARVYAFFDKIDATATDWRNKGAFMDEFARKFPAAREPVDLSRMAPEDLRADEEIDFYWNGWIWTRRDRISEGKLAVQDEQIMSEGHRPFDDYARYGRIYDLVLDGRVVVDGIVRSNPQPVVDGTTLNMCGVFVKDTPVNAAPYPPKLAA